MKKIIYLMIFLSVKAISFSQIFPSFGDERAGVSLLSALKLGAGARASSLGEAFTAIADDASALYWNPAGLSEMTSNSAQFSYAQMYAELKYYNLNAVYQLTENDFIGFSANMLTMPNIKVTNEFKPLGTGEYFRFYDAFFGLTYTRRFTEQFSSGITIRYVKEELGKASLHGLLFDAGTYYKTGLGTSRFAVSMSNFGNQMSPDGNAPTVGESPNYNGGTISSFQKFSPPTVFRIGFATEAIQDKENKLTLAIQLNHPSDNAENYSIGAEYTASHDFLKPIECYFRAGTKLNVDQDKFACGLGLKSQISENYFISFDYSYNYYKTLPSVQRITCSFNWK